MEYQYMIKKLGSQEMGSRDTREGKSSRGRYILIPRPSLKIFPFLSDTQENDYAFIGLTPIYRLRNGSYPPKCYLDYVYHNSKVVYQQKNGRDEHRIYLSKKLDEGEFFTGDIIVIRRLSDSEILSIQDRDDVEVPDAMAMDVDEGTSHKAGYEYYIDWIRPDLQTDEWTIYNTWIEKLGRKGATSVIVSDRIDFFESKVANACPDGLVVDDKIAKAFDDFGKDADAGIGGINFDGLDSYAKLFNAQSFREFVLTTYGNNCAITNEAICYGSLNNLEAAHIHPRCHGGFYLPQNGIAMRRDIHWAFDKGMFYIDPETFQVHVHPLLKSSYLGRYEGNVIRPKTAQFAPYPEFLKYHRSHIYGSFQITGSLKTLS